VKLEEKEAPGVKTAELRSKKLMKERRRLGRRGGFPPPVKKRMKEKTGKKKVRSG